VCLSDRFRIGHQHLDLRSLPGLPGGQELCGQHWFDLYEHARRAALARVLAGGQSDGALHLQSRRASDGSGLLGHPRVGKSPSVVNQRK
jgi:hypothetical protein